MLTQREAKNKYNFKTKKSLGQNFLNDKNILKKIVEKANINKNTNVIEVGPGLGALTEILVKNANHVVSVEFDKSLEHILKENIQEKNFTLIMDDFLQTDLKSLVELFPKTLTGDVYDIHLVANLPYYITQAIIMKVLTSNVNIKSMTIMLQKEVAERIFAKPKTKEYGLLTIFTELYADKEFLFEVPRSCFSPVPNVDSAVIRLVKKPLQLCSTNIGSLASEVVRTRTKAKCSPRNSLLAHRSENIDNGTFNDGSLASEVVRTRTKVDNENYLNNLSTLLHAAFSQRRKTLVNCLSANGFGDKEKIVEALNSLNINPLARAEEVSLQQYIKLVTIL